MRSRWVSGLAVLLLASAVQAGPIGWGYAAKLDSVGGAPGYAGFITTAQSIHSQYVSKLDGAAGTRFGWQKVLAGSITPTDGGGDPLADIPLSWQLTFRLTDSASGEWGEVVVTGGTDEKTVWEGEPPFQYPVSRHVTPLGLDPADSQKLSLGGNDYRVTVTGRAGDDGTGYLDAAVSVGEVSQTPEPGTLAVAGVALATAAGVWWRRRRK